MTSTGQRILGTIVLALAGVAVAAPPAAAHGFGPSAPAGGGEVLQIVIGTIVGMAAAGVAAWVIMAHRDGRTDVLRRLAAFSERVSGLPGWAALPIGVLGGSLIIADFGMYWDIATHIDSGRDSGPFANAAHYFILVGLAGIFLAGALACTLPDRKPSESAVRLPGGIQAPLGGVLIIVCAAVALSAFPLDDMWHRIFGQDVTLWGPTHLLLFGGAALTVLGGFVLAIEGRRALPADRVEPGGPSFARKLATVGFAGALLIALSTFQGEYDYAVPQFRLIMHPILLMFAAGIALVAARIHLGRGGALLAVGFYLLIRVPLTLLVSPLFGHTTLHFPLYLVEGLAVEAVAMAIATRRTLAFGAAAGAAIGTFGLAAEWAWSHIWYTVEWPSSLLPEAPIAGFVMAVAAGVVGAMVGRALTADEPGALPVPRLAGVAAALAIVAVAAYGVPVSDGDPVSADVTLDEAVRGKERAVDVTARLDPPDAADDADWFVLTAWQGEEGRSVVSQLKETAPGVWRSQEPLPVHGSWKASLRLAKGTGIQGMAVYFPEDKAIPAPAVHAASHFVRPFQKDKKLLQREQKPGVSGALVTVGYLIVLAIALALVSALVAGLARLQRVTRSRAGGPVEENADVKPPVVPVA
ncbi:MAG TPA: hypothetical protein VF520_16075 [Thermoleophilaceae bacterium]|jgi:hypothetical protein